METIAKKSTTFALLEKYKVSVRKNFGQNFIIDPSVVEKIAQHSGITDTTTVIEIGPGLGALTQQLAKLAQRVIAYEIDPQMVEVLKESVSDGVVEVVFQDFLEVDLDALKLDDVVICSNVPYYITTPILFKCLESALPFRQMTLMVQKEMAQRLGAKVNSKHYNALSIMMELFFTRKNVMNVPANCFYPKPNVDSSVIALVRNENKVDEFRGFIQFVKQSFTQRRKTLVNNLKASYPEIEQILKDLKLSSSIRAQELTLNQFLEIYKEANHEA